MQPASVDLRLGDSFRVFHNHRMAAIDLRHPPENLTEEVIVPEGESFVIHPGEFCLGRTLEWVELPDDIVARIEGKSSLGRLGLIVHATAGFCDPGWKGTLTLELNNLTRVPIKLYPGLEIAQLSFMTLDRPAARPYGSPELGSHYQGQRAATASRYRSPSVHDAGAGIEIGSRRAGRRVHRRRAVQDAVLHRGGVLAIWAVVLAGIGLTQPEFPYNARGQRGVIALQHGADRDRDRLGHPHRPLDRSGGCRLGPRRTSLAASGVAAAARRCRGWLVGAPPRRCRPRRRYSRAAPAARADPVPVDRTAAPAVLEAHRGPAGRGAMGVAPLHQRDDRPATGPARPR